MQNFAESFWSSLTLIVTGDPELWSIVILSLQVSLTAVVLAALVGVPTGALLAVGKFRGRQAITIFVNSLIKLNIFWDIN